MRKLILPFLVILIAACAAPDVSAPDLSVSQTLAVRAGRSAAPAPDTTLAAKVKRIVISPKQAVICRYNHIAAWDQTVDNQIGYNAEAFDSANVSLGFVKADFKSEKRSVGFFWNAQGDIFNASGVGTTKITATFNRIVTDTTSVTVTGCTINS